MDTLERILELQKQSGLTVKALEAATGISNGSFSKWKKGTYAPSAEAVLRLAKYFHVSTDYLFCLSDSPYPKVEISLTRKEKILIDAYRAADDMGQLNIIYVCLDEMKKKSKREQRKCRVIDFVEWRKNHV